MFVIVISHPPISRNDGGAVGRNYAATYYDLEQVVIASRLGRCGDWLSADAVFVNISASQPNLIHATAAL